MIKYLKVCLILFSICLVCAVAVSGVNMFTSPVIDEYQTRMKMEAYESLFPEMATNSEFIESGFRSSYVKEKVNVVDAEGNSLGYGFQVSGQNQYGTITLVVALDTEGNLIGLTCTENGQTGGRNLIVNNYLENFTSGMTAEDVANTPTVTGATRGTELVKNLLAAAFAETGITSPIQDTLTSIFGDSVDMAQSEKDPALIYPQQVKVGYKVKDSSGTKLGYYYEVEVTNRYGKIDLGVALDPDKKIKQINQIEVMQTPYGENDTTGVAENIISGIKPGADYDSVNSIDVVAGASYSSSSAKCAVLVALAEANKEFKEDLALELMFGDSVKTTEIEDKLDSVDKYQEIKDKDGKQVGYAITAIEANSYGNIKLYVGIKGNKDNATLAGIFVIENGQTNGRNDSLGDFIDSFTSGMSGTEAMSVGSLAGATFASNTAKSIIATAFEQVTGVRPRAGYDEYYHAAFDGVDTSKSTDLETTGKDIEEAKSLFDASGNPLGYGFVLSRTYDVGQGDSAVGSLTLFVAININGTLAKVIDIENTQSGTATGLLDDYYMNFTDGMSSMDVSNVAGVSGATYGSDNYKELIQEAMSEVVNYTPYFEEAFGKDAEFSDLTPNRKEVLQVVEAKKDDKILGYGVVVSLANVYGTNVFVVALNEDKSFKQVVDINYSHSSVSEWVRENPGVFNSGMSEASVGDIKFDSVADASYTIETIKLGILIAMDCVNNEVSEAITDELYIKSLFPQAVMGRTSVANITNTGALRGYVVNGANGTSLGYVYFLTVENEDIVISLVVALDSNHNYLDSIITNYTTKISININGSFSDTLEAKVKAYLTSLKGKGLSAILSAGYMDKASYASQLIKYALTLCIYESNGKSYPKPSMSELYSDNLIYLSAIPGLDLMKATRITDFKYPSTKQTTESGIQLVSTISGIQFKLNDSDSNYNKAYIIEVINPYSHNYILVYLGSDNKLISIYDVENNHGDIGDEVISHFVGLDQSGVSDIQYDTVNADSSFTVEMTRLAVLQAMAEASSETSDAIDLEVAIKEIFPFAVYTRSKDVTNKFINIGEVTVTKAIEVRGISSYQVDQVLGYAIFTKINDKEVLLAFDDKGNYVDFRAKELCEDDKNFLEDVKGTSRSDLDDLTGNDTIKNILVTLADVINWLKLKDIYEEYSYINSSVIESGFTNPAIEQKVEVKDTSNNLLGDAYLIYLTNEYGYNRMLVALNSDGTFKKLVDIENNHADLTEIAGVFTDGSDIDAIIEEGKSDKAIQIGSSYTSELATLGIKIAMNEEANGEDTSIYYETIAKMLFPLMVLKHSKPITPSGNIVAGYEVYGTLNYQNGSYLGYVYFVKDGDVTLAIGISDTGLVGVMTLSGDVGSFVEANYQSGLNSVEVSEIKGSNDLENTVVELVKEAYNAYYDDAMLKTDGAETLESITAFKGSRIIYGASVKDHNNNVIARGYVLYGKTSAPRDPDLALLVIVNEDDSLNSVSLIFNGQTAGRDKTVSDFVNNSFTSGMTKDDIDKVEAASGATLGTSLVIDLIKEALAEGGNN